LFPQPWRIGLAPDDEQDTPERERERKKERERERERERKRERENLVREMIIITEEE
jgi:hypothetical protein